MFENLKLQPEDKIMALMSLFKADEEEKIDLGVGFIKIIMVKPIAEGASSKEKRLLF